MFQGIVHLCQLSSQASHKMGGLGMQAMSQESTVPCRIPAVATGLRSCPALLFFGALWQGAGIEPVGARGIEAQGACWACMLFGMCSSPVGWHAVLPQRCSSFQPLPSATTPVAQSSAPVATATFHCPYPTKSMCHIT